MTGHKADLSSIPFINITCYKKNKIFSVNELSNNIASVDYRWYRTLIPSSCSRIKSLYTVDLASMHSQGHRLLSFWSCSANLTTVCPFISIVSHVVTLLILWDPFWSPFSHPILSHGIHGAMNSCDAQFVIVFWSGGEQINNIVYFSRT